MIPLAHASCVEQNHDRPRGSFYVLHLQKSPYRLCDALRAGFQFACYMKLRHADYQGFPLRAKVIKHVNYENCSGLGVEI